MSEPRRPGRPRLSAACDTSQVNVKLPADLHDAACQTALHEGVTVSELIREAIARRVNSVSPNLSLR